MWRNGAALTIRARRDQFGFDRPANPRSSTAPSAIASRDGRIGNGFEQIRSQWRSHFAS